MHLIGQRWEYRIGNNIVMVDNAYTYSMWGQERLLVNGEEAQVSGSWLRLVQSYREPWLTQLGEGELRVRLHSGIGSIRCKAWLDGELIEPEEIYDSGWHGPAYSWPDEDWWTAWPRTR